MAADRKSAAGIGIFQRAGPIRPLQPAFQQTRHEAIASAENVEDFDRETLAGLAGIAWFGGFTAGLGWALLMPGKPSWRLPPLSDRTALALRAHFGHFGDFRLVEFAVAITVEVSFNPELLFNPCRFILKARDDLCLPINECRQGFAGNGLTQTRLATCSMMSRTSFLL